MPFVPSKKKENKKKMQKPSEKFRNIFNFESGSSSDETTDDFTHSSNLAKGT